MEQFLRVEGVAAPLLHDNIDTDLLIPSREMTAPGKEGYGEKLLAPWRYLATSDGSRQENPDFVLNRAPFRQAKFLLAGANFGSGSSREQAAWALRQFGIRAVLAPSFGAIFQDNCYRNGLLPVMLPRADVEALAQEAQAGGLALAVDLEKQSLEAPGGRNWPLQVPASERAMMLAGLDSIGLTLRRQHQITAFQQADRQLRPWI
jgi:3-isopropylmalate/(R)-2-methylmalate dehydratase small subunit